jgi:mannopine transport system substrate-binding protein
MRISRRDLLGATGAILAAPAVRAQGKAEVVIATTGGLMTSALQDNFYKRFEAETGIRVRAVPIELPEQWARAEAGARSGTVPFDVVTATPPAALQHADILTTLDCAGMPGIVANALPGSCFPTGIIRTIGGMVLTWSKKAFPNGGPQSWADFFDVAKFPGPRALPETSDREWWMPLIALQADGVPRDKLFPIDFDRAYKKLDTIKPHVAVWWKSGDHSMQVMRGGDAVATMLYSSRAVLLSQSGECDFTWNGALRDVGMWAVLKGGPNTANGIKFLDFFVQNPQAHLRFSATTFSNSNNKDVAAMIPPEERRYRANWPANLVQLIVPDYAWIAERRSAMRDGWVEWLSR